jgi:hypothetical protein
VGYYALNGDTSKNELKQSDLFIVNNIEEHPYEKPFGRLKDNLKEYVFETNASEKNKSLLIIYSKKERDALKNLAVPVYIGKFNSKIAHLYLPPDVYVTTIISEQ